MVNNSNLCFLTMVASGALVLATLGAISTLWPHVPTQEGLANFAFALAVAFASFLGNAILFGCYLLISNRGSKSKLRKFTAVLSVLILFVCLLVSSIYFTEGLNSWFDKVPLMPKSLVFIVRATILVPIALLLIILPFRIFSKKSIDLEN